MRRWLPIVLLLAAAGLVAFALSWHSNRAPSIAGAHSQAPEAPQSDPNVEELAPAEVPDSRSAAEATPQVREVDPGAAHVLVHVRGKSKRTPVAGADVVAWDDRATGHDYNSAWLDIPAVSGQTDAAGDVSLEVRPEIPLSISASVMERNAGSASIPLAALRPGQHREVEILLPDGDDAHVSGRIVDTETRAAIVGARVACIDARPGYSSDGSHWGAVELARTTTGLDGGFELDHPSWREPHLRVEAEGYGVRLAEPLAECSDPAHPLVIELARSASLRAHLVDADGRALDALRVELSLDGYQLIPEDQTNRTDLHAAFPDEHWESKTDREGWVSFADLPAQTPIIAHVHMGARVVQPDDKFPEFAPGEAREVEWRMGAGCALSGLVLDTQGKPVTRIQVWLTKAWRGSAAYFSPESQSLVHQVSTTDMEGRFEMVGVPKGEWFVGPAPDGPRYANEASVAPAAQRIVVGEERSKQLTLRVDRGLFIRGRVLDPDGKPVSGAEVEVGDDERGWLRLFGRCEHDGTFAVGPLPAGAVSLFARGYRNVTSPRVRAEPGSSGVELRLRRGGTIRGRVVDATTGAGCLASLEFALEGSELRQEDEWNNGGSEDDGTFESPPLLSGAYSIGATTEDGRFGAVKGIGVTAGSTQSDVVVRMQPGGTLRLKYDGAAETVWGRILCDGVLLSETGPLRKGKLQTLRLPAGGCMLELSDEHALLARETISLRTGETRDLVLGDKK